MIIDKIINELKQEEAKLQKTKDGLVDNIDQLNKAHHQTIGRIAQIQSDIILIRANEEK